MQKSAGDGSCHAVLPAYKHCNCQQCLTACVAASQQAESTVDEGHMTKVVMLSASNMMQTGL